MHWAGGCVSQHALGREDVCQGCLPRGVSAWGCLPWGVCPGEGVSTQGRGCLPRGGGVYPGGMSAQGVSDQGVYGRHPPVNRMTDTGVKTLPCRNFVEGGLTLLNQMAQCEKVHFHAGMPSSVSSFYT